MSNPLFSPTNNLEDEFISSLRELLKHYKITLVQYKDLESEFYFTNDAKYRDGEIFISSTTFRNEIGYEDRD